MEKVKPITIGIIALLLVLLSLNFVPKTSKNLQTTSTQVTQQSPAIKSNQTISQSNAELIQKNIDFLKEHLEALKADSITQSPKPLADEDPQPIISNVNPILQNPSHSESQTQNNQEKSPIIDNQTESQTTPTMQCQRTKPQLAIILDDIGSLAQYQALTRINYKITPSFFPKSKTNPKTPEIAKIAPFFMVHLPLEALNFYQAEHEWLFVGDSRAKIEQRIQTIKQDFPTLSYLNNHTGSKFTQSLDSMTLLLETLAKYKISFWIPRLLLTQKQGHFMLHILKKVSILAKGNFWNAMFF